MDEYQLAFPSTANFVFIFMRWKLRMLYLNHASSFHSRNFWVSRVSLCSSAVKQPREAALDAQLLVVATDLGKEKATQLFSEGNAFDPSVFAEHLVSDIVLYNIITA